MPPPLSGARLGMKRLFRLDDSVEHGNLVFQCRDAGSDIAGQSCVSSENWEGEGGVVFGFCSCYSLMAIGIAPFRQLQQGVVDVVLHRGSPASGTSGVCGYLPSVFPLTQAAADEARRSSPNA